MGMYALRQHNSIMAILVCRYFIPSKVHFVIKGRIEAYVHEGKEGSGDSREGGSGLTQASYLGVWGPGSLWGLNNVLFGGRAEVMCCMRRRRVSVSDLRKTCVSV